MDDLTPLLTETAPLLAVVVVVGRWLATRIDRVLDMHQRLIERCYDRDDRDAAQRLP